jgi:hypothetical protein
MNNLAEDPDHRGRLRAISQVMWRYVRETGDHVLENSHYPILRVAPFGPHTGQ